jgi:hypothetical protein
MRSSLRRFDDVLVSEGIGVSDLSPRSPNLNAFAERRVRSVEQERLSRLILFGERSLQRVLTGFVAHFHSERNHQGQGNILLFPPPKRKGAGEEYTVEGDTDSILLPSRLSILALRIPVLSQPLNPAPTCVILIDDC